MWSIGKRLVGPLCILIFCGFMSNVHAETQIYNFNTRFVNGEATPLINRSADIGDSTFLASFTSSPVASAFVINGPSSLNSLFSGGALQQLNFSLNTLTIDFNTPVVRVSADFATFSDASLSLTTAVGSTTQLSGSVGGFPGGTIFFSSITPFTRIQLSSSSFFAIDNMILDTPVTPTIAGVITAVQEAVANGTLIGNGPGRSASGRLAAWRNMLNAVQLMIESGNVAGACAQLQDIYLRVDGVFPPPDFVTGEAAPALASMIQALRKQLGCF